MTPPIPRGTVIRKRVGVQPIDEAEDFFKFEACGGWIDMRDLGRDPRSRRALAASGVRSSAVSQLQPPAPGLSASIHARQVCGHHGAALGLMRSGQGSRLT
jgi:hypothetical protein